MSLVTYDDTRFLRETVVDVDAAVVGVSKARWAFITEQEATAEEAARRMQDNRFDILPIVDGATGRGYFQTEIWNDFSAVSRKAISHRDVIPCHTHIRGVIKGLATEGRLFYFLGHEHRVIGLLSIVNLNDRQIKVYLFSLLSELEIRLGGFISAHVSEDDMYQIAFAEPLDWKHRKTKNRYDKDRAKGVDTAFVEYLYLLDLIKIALQRDLYAQLGYGSKEAFQEALNPLNNLRNAVAHPSRSLITNVQTVEQLWCCIDRIEELLFALR
jgi:CBS domain-containing protein